MVVNPTTNLTMNECINVNVLYNAYWDNCLFYNGWTKICASLWFMQYPLMESPYLGAAGPITEHLITSVCITRLWNLLPSSCMQFLVFFFNKQQSTKLKDKCSLKGLFTNFTRGGEVHRSVSSTGIQFTLSVFISVSATVDFMVSWIGPIVPLL